MSEAMALAARIAAAEVTPYAWYIDRDRDAELSANPGESEVGTSGPSNAPESLLEQAKAGNGVRFRLMDEGDIDECNADSPHAVKAGERGYGVVYEGVLVDPTDSWPFGPLDDFGRPNYGCISIQHYNEDTERFEWV